MNDRNTETSYMMSIGWMLVGLLALILSTVACGNQSYAAPFPNTFDGLVE